ncbi:MAG: FAD-dependent oxidoreductase, partial [Xanthomonadales bacterium]|nr:FAD-dependent oxidoreductase [Xanthomonadales bacterium]
MKPARCAIVGAGIAGASVAFWLAVRHGLTDVVLIDRDQPLSFTTASSGENFRDCWPQPWMTDLMVRSIHLMDEFNGQSGGAFTMRYSGYEFVSESREAEMFGWGARAAQAGEGSVVRISGDTAIRAERPYLSPSIRQLLRMPRAGYVDVQGLG